MSRMHDVCECVFCAAEQAYLDAWWATHTEEDLDN